MSLIFLALRTGSPEITALSVIHSKRTPRQLVQRLMYDLSGVFVTQGNQQKKESLANDVKGDVETVASWAKAGS